MTPNETSYRSKSVRLKAADSQQQIVVGAVLVPNEVDHAGDFFREKTIRTIEKGFVESTADSTAKPAGDIPGLDRAGAGGVLHAIWPDDHLELVGSKVLDSKERVGTGDLSRTFPRGTWLVAYKIHDDDLWSLVKDDTLGGFSVGMFVSETKTYPPGDLPRDVRIPDAVRERFADHTADPEDMAIVEVLKSDCHEISIVDTPAVPSAVHVAHKSASSPALGSLDQWGEHPDQHAPYALAKAAGALTESFEACVEYLRGRGHSESAAKRLANYLQRTLDSLDPATRAAMTLADTEHKLKSLQTDTMPTTDELLENAEMNCKMINQLAMKLNEDSTIENAVVPRDGLPQRTRASYFGLDKIARSAGMDPSPSAKKEASLDLSKNERAEKLIAQNTENLARLTGLL